MGEEVHTPSSDMNETQLLRGSKQLLNVLLKDYTTGSNIKWGTDSYTAHGSSFHGNQEITVGLITGWYDGFIRPRADKDKDIQLERQRSKAEVFTPSWIVKLQVDAAVEDMKDLPLLEFIQTKWIEITCGEAPYMVNRYDMNTGSVIRLDKRAGFMDVKFRRLNQEVQNEDEWIKFALEIYKSSYGYEYQGDSLLLARENLMLTFIDNYFYMFGAFPDNKLILEVSKIVSLNVFQMDGLTKKIPYSNGVENKLSVQLSLFEASDDEVTEEPQLAEVKCWNSNKKIHFNDMVEKDGIVMNFDVAIGNPPYQLTTIGNNRDVPIYPYFMDESYKIAKKSILITPARFLFGAGQTSQAWNKKMLKDPHLKVLYFDQYSGNIFENTDIKGGVAVTYYDNEKEFGAINVFIRSKELETIVNRDSVKNEDSIKLIHYNRSSYRLTDSVYEDFPELKKRVKKSERLSITSNIFDKLPELFSSEKPYNDYEYIELIGRQNNERKIKWIRSEFVQSHPTLGKWKLFIAKSNGTGALGEALSEPVVAKPRMIPTQTFIALGDFDSEDEALALNKYVKSKFARAMLSVEKATPDNARKEVWSYVPLQDFTTTSDIDWSQSVSEIDQQLYKKYGLSEDEINFIETNVKEMK